MKISDAGEPFERAAEENGKIWEKEYKALDSSLEKGESKESNKEGEITERPTSEKVEEYIMTSQSGMTVAPVVECLYQYPDLEQFNAMLSNMMNELTKVFVRVHKLMHEVDGRRRQETRFRVVAKKATTYFEGIYSNMTREYSEFYNNVAGHVARAGEDPCNNQAELKEVWRKLLEHSLSSLRDAAQSCIEEFLRSQNKSHDRKARARLEQFLARELQRIKTGQLDMLCDRFQLCFNELL
ncbi:uncharacterized protein LOC114364181 [Ostrinia furnacalis]|uniref:uncharacterized protein LOC114364181 n=1 Tax=Ostrinia furnacalis TaxID=93504 RepID=UPI0010404002|nr:uncharacterized protein LOC114364181 [Ostrinia furnacalis]